jgi:hypothetical protein
MENDRPVFPQVTRSQWEVLSALTDQRCVNLMEAMDFVADLSPEAKHFLLKADKEKIDQLNDTMSSYINTRTVWRFLLIGGGVVVSFVTAASVFFRTFSEYITIKWK